MKNKDLLGGRPLNPQDADLLGGYPLSVEVSMMKPRKKADFLGGDGIGLLSIDREVKRKYKEFPAVKDATFYGKGVIKGSNPFYVVAINEMLDEGRRTATQADLEEILENNTLDLSKVFVDTALVLRSTYRPNKYLAKKLAGEIITKFPIRAKYTLFPVIIPLAGLELEEDQNSRYGLAFKLKDNPDVKDVIIAPELRHKNNNKRFSRTEGGSGIPLFNEKGKRVLHTRESGLSRLYLSEGNLYSDFNYLDCSGAYGTGRVVVVNKS